MLASNSSIDTETLNIMFNSLPPHIDQFDNDDINSTASDNHLANISQIKMQEIIEERRDIENELNKLSAIIINTSMQ
jgi:hypothetical protein